MEDQINVSSRDAQQNGRYLADKLVEVPEKTMTIFPVIVAVVAVCFVIFGSTGYYLGKQRADSLLDLKQDVTLPTPQVSPTKTANSAVPTQPSTNTTLPHEYLPGFNIIYANSWSISKIKQFRDDVPQDFVSNYFPNCHGRCMGIRLSKSDVSLDLLFDVAFDSNGLKCSNSVAYQSIANNWYRIKDSSGYFYTNTAMVNKTLEDGKIPSPFGKVADEWSAVAGTTYKVCVQGSGRFLTKYSKVEVGETGKGVPILMEFPTVRGNPNATTLKELDAIVSSIEGLN